MAIGDYSNNTSTNSNGGNNGKLFEQTYYSRLKIRNIDNKLTLSVNFRSGLMIIDVSEQKDGFKYESLGTIHLSPTKAALFANEIAKFKNYYLHETIVPGKAFGVNAGMNEKVSYIGIHADNSRNILLTVGKIDGSGNILEQVTIPMNKEYHYSLEWDNISEMDLAKVYDDMIELDQLHNTLHDFGRYMNGALAYSVADLTRYDNARILGKMDPIYDKLGIERKTSNNSFGNSRSGNSFLDNSRSVISNHTSFDSIEGMMDDE